VHGVVGRCHSSTMPLNAKSLVLLHSLPRDFQPAVHSSMVEGQQIVAATDTPRGLVVLFAESGCFVRVFTRGEEDTIHQDGGFVATPKASALVWSRDRVVLVDGDTLYPYKFGVAVGSSAMLLPDFDAAKK